MKSKLNLESELLLKILNNNDQEIEKIICQSEIDWNLILTLAKNHELLPFVYYKFKDKANLISQDALNYLEKAYAVNLARNLILWDELVKIYKTLQEQNIEVIPIKGFDLEIRFEGILHLRTMKDIDVLIKKEKIDQVGEVLLALGYRKELSSLKEEYWREKQCHIAFRKKSKKIPEGILVEVHWALDLPRKKQMFPNLWKRSYKKEYKGKEFLLLSPEDNLFAFILHNRRFGNILSLKQVFDLKKILEDSNLDWQYILKSGKNYRLKASLYFGLAQLKFLNELKEINEILDKIKIPHWKKLAIEKLIKNSIFLPDILAIQKQIFLKAHFLLYDSLWESISYILNIPYEQFCKFYRLKPYTKKSLLLYHIRLLYILFPFKK